jgi:signal transduction histidine kinase
MGAPLVAAEQPKRVLILHSYAPEFGDYFAKNLRSELNSQLPGRLDLYENWLVSARFASQGEDSAYADYLSALFADRPFDLVITLGGPAANFVQRHQPSLFPNTPVLMTGVDERRVAAFSLSANETAVTHLRGDDTVIANIMRVLPDTSTLAVVIGDSPLDRYWAEQIRASARAYHGRLNLVFLNDLSYQDVLKRAAALPSHSAIYFELFFADVKGIPGDMHAALAQLHAASSAPIFSHLDTYFGEGLVGGPMIPTAEVGRQATQVVARILAGERPADIKVPSIRLAAPRFDARELRRWHIRESDLPAGSEVAFREPTAWESYHWQILAVIALILLQTALIASLLYERRRRRSAEVEAHRRLTELAHMNRRAAIGELSASITHELYQPLTAILANTETAELLVGGLGTDTGELQEILADIRRDDLRASEVIRGLRRMLAKAPVEPHEVNLNEVVSEVFAFLSTQASARHVALSTQLVMPAPRVSGDRIQLQQVILNLVMNALDAIEAASSGERRVIGRTTLVNDDTAEVSVEDTGPGIPGDRVHLMFEPFFTTKQAGMGMGLSIARTIVQSHHGRIWAEERRGGGAVFRFSLPLARGPAPGHSPERRAAGITSPAPAPPPAA